MLGDIETQKTQEAQILLSTGETLTQISEGPNESNEQNDHDKKLLRKYSFDLMRSR
jgi:hypothetical protein